MALKKEKIKFGFKADYWRIINYRIERQYNRADVVIGLYKSKEDADNDVQPLEIVRKRIFDRPQPKGSKLKEHTAYTDNLSTEAMSGRHKGKNILEILYQAIKEIEPIATGDFDFKDAEDC